MAAHRRNAASVTTIKSTFVALDLFALVHVRLRDKYIALAIFIKIDTLLLSELQNYHVYMYIVYMYMYAIGFDTSWYTYLN